jgi:hypothetical protein
VNLFPLFLAEEAGEEYGRRVRVLSAEVAHRIAAREVIERPASAVNFQLPTRIQMKSKTSEGFPRFAVHARWAELRDLRLPLSPPG